MRTLQQRSFARESLELTIEGDTLHCVRSSWFYHYSYDVRLADIVPKTQEWRRIAVSWYLVAGGALVLLAVLFRYGWRLDPVNVLAGLSYVVFGGYCLNRAWAKSGSYLVVHVAGEDPQSIWIHRRKCDQDEVARFLQEMFASVQREKKPVGAASPAATPV